MLHPSGPASSPMDDDGELVEVLVRSATGPDECTVHVSPKAKLAAVREALVSTSPTCALTNQSLSLPDERAARLLVRESMEEIVFE